MKEPDRKATIENMLYIEKCALMESEIKERFVQRQAILDASMQMPLAMAQKEIAFKKNFIKYLEEISKEE